VTPTLSVDAVHVRLTCVCDVALPFNPVGAVGGVVSGAEPVTVTEVDCVVLPPVPEHWSV
jgi:hypothetical protein